MRLRLRFPALSHLDCGVCQQWIYQIPSGIPDTYEGDDGELTLQERPPGTAPCDKCPKSINGGPDINGVYKLSNENEQLLSLYWRSKSPGFRLPDHLVGDPAFAELFGAMEQIIHDTERQMDREHTGNIIASMLRRV